jgi:endonuclease/exonuclease/phosphatase family metal-dependent hydrolase
MERLKVCTWNIQLGLALDDVLAQIQFNPDFRGIDVFLFQEASRHFGSDDADLIKKVLGAHFEAYQVNNQIIKGWLQGNAIVWNSHKLKLSEKRSVILPDRSGAPTRSERTAMRMLPQQVRNIVSVEGTIGDHSVRFYSTHLTLLSWKGHRRAQVRKLLEDESSRKKVDLVIAGADSNMYHFRSRYPDWGEIYQDLKEAGFITLTKDLDWTFQHPLFRFKQKLDLLVVKPKDIKHRCWKGELKGSDHTPVFAELEIP